MSLSLSYVCILQLDDEGWSVDIVAQVGPPPPPASRSKGGKNSKKPVESASDRLPNLSKDSTSLITIGELRSSDVVVMHTSKDSMGPRALLGNLRDHFKYNDSMRSKIDQLYSSYVGWRSVRGDGNCYYRAIIFGLLEQAVYAKNRSRIFAGLLGLFKPIQFLRNSKEQALHSMLLDTLAAARGGS
jgi:hypothetical protein